MSAESMGERQIARINVTAERQYLAAILAFLRQAAGQLGLGAPDVAGLEHAVEQVCLNVVEHGFEPGQAGSFEVALLRRPGHLVVAVEDRGLPFDFARLGASANSGAAGPSASTCRCPTLARGISARRSRRSASSSPGSFRISRRTTSCGCST